MASTTRTTNKATYTVLTASLLTSLRNKMMANKMINAADVNNMLSCVREIYSHTHVYYDLAWSQYGNTSPYSTTAYNKNTGIMNLESGKTVPSAFTGKTIEAKDMHVAP